jgi:hypothetical protein
MSYKFNPFTGKFDIAPSGYTGDFYDSTQTKIATVQDGLIKTVVFSAVTTPPATGNPVGLLLSLTYA